MTPFEDRDYSWLPLGCVTHTPEGNVVVAVDDHGTVLISEGQYVSKADYPELYSALEGAYGETNEEFRLPNFQKKMIGLNDYLEGTY